MNFITVEGTAWLYRLRYSWNDEVCVNGMGGWKWSQGSCIGRLFNLAPLSKNPGSVPVELHTIIYIL